MATRKKYPEIQLPPILANAAIEYLGARTVNKLSSDQRTRIAQATARCATEIGAILEPD